MVSKSKVFLIFFYLVASATISTGQSTKEEAMCEFGCFNGYAGISEEAIKICVNRYCKANPAIALDEVEPSQSHDLDRWRCKSKCEEDYARTGEEGIEMCKREFCESQQSLDQWVCRNKCEEDSARTGGERIQKCVMDYCEPPTHRLDQRICESKCIENETRAEEERIKTCIRDVCKSGQEIKREGRESSMTM